MAYALENQGCKQIWSLEALGKALEPARGLWNFTEVQEFVLGGSTIDFLWHMHWKIRVASKSGSLKLSAGVSNQLEVSGISFKVQEFVLGGSTIDFLWHMRWKIMVAGKSGPFKLKNQKAPKTNTNA